MAFTPKHLDESVQRELVLARLKDFEQQRFIHGLDRDAVDAVVVTEANDQAVKQDKVNLGFAIERLDAQLATYEAALDALPPESASE